MHTAEFYELLTKEYSLILATTREDIQAVRTIRENVYSLKYNKPLEYLDSIGLIQDKDDEQAFIYLLQHNTTKKYVGTVRVFFINKHTSSQVLPMQQTVKDKHVFTLLQDLPVIEITRSALTPEIPKHEIYSELALRTSLTYGLMIATRVTLMLYHPYLVFSIMEPTLHRILRRQKVNFEPISDSVDSYGTLRIPYAIKTNKLLGDTEENMGKLTKYYLKQMCENPEKLWQFVDNNAYLDRSDIHLERICKLFKEYGDDVDIALLLGEDQVLE